MSATMSIWLVSVAMGFPQANADAIDVIAPGATLEKVWGEGTFTEGGATDQDGSILFSDIGNRIMRFDPKTGKTKVFREPSGRANGMIFDSLGGSSSPRGPISAAAGGFRSPSATGRSARWPTTMMTSGSTVPMTSPSIAGDACTCPTRAMSGTSRASWILRGCF